MLAQRCRRSPDDRAGTPPRTCALPPAGWTSWSSSSRSAAARPSGPKTPAGRSGAAPTLDFEHDEASVVGVDERPGPRLVGADLALRARPRDETRRAGRPRAGAGASASPPPRAAAAVRSSPRIHGPRLRSSSRSATTIELSSSRGAVSVPSRATRSWATIGPVSSPASIRMSVTPVSVSPARIVAGIGVAPRWRGRSDGWRFRAPCSRSSSAGGTICP